MLFALLPESLTAFLVPLSSFFSLNNNNADAAAATAALGALS
jgi:hypothetical protein